MQHIGTAIFSVSIRSGEIGLRLHALRLPLHANALVPSQVRQTAGSAGPPDQGKSSHPATAVFTQHMTDLADLLHRLQAALEASSSHAEAGEETGRSVASLLGAAASLLEAARLLEGHGPGSVAGTAQTSRMPAFLSLASGFFDGSCSGRVSNSSQ